jgi:hypothetical protein
MTRGCSLYGEGQERRKEKLESLNWLRLSGTR